MRELPQRIKCETKEEQDMLLDIFEMLGYKWNAGQLPREYRSNRPPCTYLINNYSHCFGHISYHSDLPRAKDLRNMWISLKRRNYETKSE